MRDRFKDPRLIAAAIAVGCMFIDDLPEPHYNTFRDPGASTILSIIFADAITAIGRPTQPKRAVLAFILLLPLKLFIQPLFWVENAWFWDSGALLLTHGVLGFAAVRRDNLRARVICAAETLAALLLLMILLDIAFPYDASWRVHYLQILAARISIPVTFWAVVCRREARSAPPIPTSDPALPPT